jgi:hypothetical protein
MGIVARLDGFEAVYATPRFEGEVLRRLGLPPLPAWRAADLIRVTLNGSARRPARIRGRSRPSPGTWSRFIIGDQVVAVADRGRDDGPILYEPPSPTIHNFALDSVSARDARRNAITIWTSRNLGANATGTRRIATVLSGRAHATSISSVPPEGPLLMTHDRHMVEQLARDLGF